MKLLTRNRKAAKMAFATILVLLVAFAVLIWYIFFSRGLAEKGEEGVALLKDVIKAPT